MDQTRKKRRLAAVLMTIAVLAPTAPALAHPMTDNWWQYDKVVWRYGWRHDDSLARQDRRWHKESHSFASSAARQRHHRELHHDLKHQWRAKHYHRAISWHRGKATWYNHTGTIGACGVRLRGMYAAHRSLPCGSKVSVRHNGRYVWVTILDRGPFGSRDRIIDLSTMAFRQLAGLSQGVIPIRAVRVRG